MSNQGSGLIYAHKKMEQDEPCITHMCMSIRVAYAMVWDEKMCALDVKGTKCLLLGSCEETKNYKLMCL